MPVQEKLPTVNQAFHYFPQDHLSAELKDILSKVANFTAPQWETYKSQNPNISPSVSSKITQTLAAYETVFTTAEQPPDRSQEPEKKQGAQTSSSMHNQPHEHQAKYIDEDHRYLELAGENQSGFEKTLEKKYGKDWKKNNQAKLELDRYINGQTFPVDKNTKSLKSETLKQFYKEHKQKRHELQKKVKATEQQLEKLKVSRKNPLVKFVQFKSKTNQLKKERDALKNHIDTLKHYHENERQRIHEHSSDDVNVQQTHASIEKNRRKILRKSQKQQQAIEKQKEEIRTQIEETIKQKNQESNGTDTKQFEADERQKAEHQIQSLEQKQEQTREQAAKRIQAREEKQWEKFVKKHPEKTRTYALPPEKATDQDIALSRSIFQAKQRVDASEEQKKRRGTQPQITTTTQVNTTHTITRADHPQTLLATPIHPHQKAGEETEEQRGQRTGRRITWKDRFLGKESHAPSGLYGGRYGAAGKRISISKAPRLNMGRLRGRVSSLGASFSSRFMPQNSEPQQEQRELPFQLPNLINTGNDIYNTAQNVKSAVQMAQKAAQAARAVQIAIAAANPITWIVIGIILGLCLLVIIIIIIFGGGTMPQDTLQQNQQTLSGPPTGTNNPTIPGLIYSKTGPISVDNGSQITYTVSVAYTGTDDTVTVIDTLPPKTKFISASGNPDFIRRDGSDPTSEITGVSWNLSKQNNSQTLSTTAEESSSQFPQDIYRSYGFPTPTTPETMSTQVLQNYKNYLQPNVQKAGAATGVDPAIITMWAWLETGINSYASNCNDLIKNNPNYYCDHGLWQVGYGIQVYDHLKNLTEAFNAMHAGETVQSVGQKVIDGSATRGIGGAITQPSAVFPDISINELVQKAQQGDKDARMYAAILMKDDGIGAYLIGKTFKGIIGPNLAKTMQGWSSSYYDPQKIVNYIAGVYQAGISASASSEPARSYSFTLVLEPTENDIYVTNTLRATANGQSLVTPPSGGVKSGNACTEPYEGTGYCSVEYLKQFFGDNAIKASLICQAESGSNPFAKNETCSTNDYSVGLFQINLIAHCPGAFSGQFCSRTVINETKKNECERKYKDNPEENIKYAAGLSKNGADWTQWGTWLHGAGGKPAVKTILTQCGIQ